MLTLSLEVLDYIAFKDVHYNVNRMMLSHTHVYVDCIIKNEQIHSVDMYEFLGSL